MDIQDFLIRNYQWVIGAIVIPLIIYFLQKKRKEIINFFKMEQKGNKNSTFYQAKKIVIKQTGLNVVDVKEIAQSVFRENFPRLKEQAMIEAKGNVKLFIEELDRKITAKLGKEEINKFRDPDIQYVLYEAIRMTARKNSEELRRNLSTLIVERVQNDDKDLKRIVYNEAIGTIGKLTADQLKIITLCYLLGYTSHTGINSWKSFTEYLNKHIKLFLGFKNTNAEFQHIEYAGCGSIGIGSRDLINIYRLQYSFLFLNLVEQSAINTLNISDNLKDEIFVLDQQENKYFIRFKNKADLEEYLKKQSSNTDLNNKLLQLYESHIKNNEEVKKKIIEETDLGKELIGLWEKSNLRHLSLTSVGIVIAATYFEQITGEKINIDIWIN